jgi:hypothetical protein
MRPPLVGSTSPRPCYPWVVMGSAVGHDAITWVEVLDERPASVADEAA